MKMYSAELLRKYDIKLKKSLGQNLLLDPNINRKMAEVAEVAADDSVFEVGAGVGDLTQVLAERAREVFSIEIDRAFEPPLRERFGNNPKVKLFFGDILNHSVKELVDEFLPHAAVLKMVSNLPFYITSPVLMHFLESEVPFKSLTVMVQKEVAERIVAVPGGKEYGILAIACQLYARPSIARTVSPKCFRPVPKVDSAIIHLPIRDNIELSPAERRLFFLIVNAAFRQRRKKIANSLAVADLSMPKKQLEQFLSDNDIPPDVRPERVSLEKYIQLAKAIFAVKL
ncbi:MAG: ribosomal RNA small subunit methyltransferase A [Candidatus Abyssobacteria bacterium SURF_5]|uniref:Ribosomal RNA small subunit methyltransferase A n=1 Tax=Abyssobacteria bacterium (strain SURF_5) TaxID=2093360 RepID=A0A3A4NVJ3_ABYX5|nr:MAG: ribosomal RNA small subunit methyltransferase A [Candidatus Abyssubacteria bacterium SURF_5]